jgi:spermidine/putrescine transport system permease protein
MAKVSWDWQRSSRMWFTALGAPALAWLLVFFAGPFLLILLLSLGWQVEKSLIEWSWGQQFLVRTLEHPFRGIYLQSLTLAALATFLCLVMAYPLCLLLLHLGPRRGRLWMLLIMAPFLINFLVRIYAWFILLRPEGLLATGLRSLSWDVSLISSKEGVVLGFVYGYLPFMMLPLWSVMERLDLRIVEAAQDLGASFRSVFRHIIWPHTVPGVAAGSLLVAVPMLGEYCIPRLLGGGLVPTVGTTIESQFLAGVQPDWNFGAALAVVMLVGIGGILLALRKSMQKLLEIGERRIHP